MKTLIPGKQAPAFSGINQQGEPVALKDFRGKWVLVYFYPKAMTPGCTTQACHLRDAKTELAAANVAVIGISPDTPERLMKFTQKEQLHFTLVSDPDHTIADQYGVWGPKQFMGKTFDGIHRTSFILDPQGNLRHVLKKVKTKTHHQQVLEWLAHEHQSR